LSTKTLITVVDDDEDVREALTGLMRSRGYHVTGFASAAEFLAQPNVRATSCLIADVHMPGMTGFELHNRLLEAGYAIPTILITAFPDDSDRVRALSDGVIGYLAKPCEARTPARIHPIRDGGITEIAAMFDMHGTFTRFPA
jgi:FixJ family two-component response regulator